MLLPGTTASLLSFLFDDVYPDSSRHVRVDTFAVSLVCCSPSRPHHYMCWSILMFTRPLPAVDKSPSTDSSGRGNLSCHKSSRQCIESYWCLIDHPPNISLSRTGIKRKRLVVSLRKLSMGGLLNILVGLLSINTLATLML